MPDGVLTKNPRQLLHLRIPAFHSIFQIGRQYADVNRFDNVFRELFQPLILVGFALERLVQLAVIDGDADTPGVPRRLVPFAKAYSGLTDEEMRQVDQRIRQTTIEKFGPVHAVKPELVFELAFEAIQKSARHRSGIAVRFPRMARWRKDKKAEDADSLDTIRALLAEH